MVLVSLVPATSDLWDIRRGRVVIFRDLALGAAIKLARELARDEHLRSGREIRVEMPGVDGAICLALHAGKTGAAELEQAVVAA